MNGLKPAVESSNVTARNPIHRTLIPARANTEKKGGKGNRVRHRYTFYVIVYY